MRQKLTRLRVRQEERDRNYNKETYCGNRKGNGDKFPFKMRQTADSRKNNMKYR